VNDLRQAWLVAKRELRERSRSRAFLASVAIMLVAVVGAIALPALLDTTGGTKDVGVTGATPATLAAAIEVQSSAGDTKTRLHSYNTRAAGEEAVRDGEIDVLVVDSRTLAWQRRTDEKLKVLLIAAIQMSEVQSRARAAGISDQELLGLLAPVTVTNVEIGRVPGRSPDDETAASLMTVVLFMTIATYGAMVLSGVVEEKSSRVVEVLLARIPARSLLGGKIIGIGLLGLGQVALTAVAALVAATTISDVDLPAVRSGVLVWAVVWFVLGYAVYATVYGALGSLASRQEDAQSVAGPITVVLVLVYFVSFAAIGSASTGWATAVSWFPLTAPMAMPARIAMGTADWWEPIGAAVLAVAAIVGLVILGGRIYTEAVLHHGPTLKLREAWNRSRSQDRDEIGNTAQDVTDFAARPSSRPARTTHDDLRAAAIALAVALVAGGIAIALTTDVIIGIAVGAVSFTLVDRAFKSRSRGSASHA